MLAGRLLAGYWQGARCSGSARDEATFQGTHSTPSPVAATTATITFTPPSLRSLAERALTSGGGGSSVKSVLGLLSLGQRLNSPGLCAYAGAFLAANAPAVLSFLVSFKGRGSLEEFAATCEAGGRCGGGRGFVERVLTLLPAARVVRKCV